MFLTPKVESVGGIKDFLGSRNKKRTIGTIIAGLGVGSIASFTQPVPGPEVVSVAVMPVPVLGLSVTDKIIKAFDPLVQLIQGVSYPVAFIIITSGFLVMMTGNRQKGISMIKWAVIGYIGMQFAPALMSILVEVGRAMTQ
jgi:hypothetical protein